MTTLFKKSLLAATIALATGQVHAAAFQLNEHSAAGLGRAFAGEAAIGDNASVLARNPAALATFDKMEVSASATYIKPDVDVEGNIALRRAQASETNIAPSAIVPASYFIQPINENWAWGVGLFSNYGLATEYDKNFNAGSQAGDTSLVTLNLNPSLSYRLNDQWSFGAGLNAVYAEAELNRFNGEFIPVLPNDLLVKHLKGDTWGFGWNVGTLYEINDTNRIALSYRSQVSLDFDGQYRDALPPTLGGQAGKTVDANLKINLPAQIEFAGYHRIHPQIAFHYSINWTDWSAFEELKATGSNGSVLLQKDEKFEDAMRYAIGATWYVNNAWEARLGLAYDQSPIQAQYRSLSIPDSDRVWYSAGATYHINPTMSVDFGLTYIDGKRVDVDESLGPVHGPETPLNPHWKGSSHGDALLASAGFNMQF